MQTIKCTAKLRKEMGLKNPAPTEKQGFPEDPLLGAWHANLLYINRRKSVLFVNDKTLYSFIFIRLSRAEIRELANVFTVGFRLNLLLEGFSEAQIEEIMQEYTSIQFAKTDNKSVLGSMNDLAFHYKYHLEVDGEGELSRIVHKLNRMPMGALKYAYPIDKLRESVEKINTAHRAEEN